MADAKGPVFNPVEDLKIIILFFTVLWTIWFVGGGPARYETRQKPFIRPPSQPGFDGQYVFNDPRAGEQYGQIPVIKVKKVVLTKVEKPEKIVISLFKGPADSLGLSYIKLDFPLSNKRPLGITGLRLKDIFSRTITIGGASNLPYQGRVDEETEVSIGPGSTVFLIEGQSPIGVSFRINKCIGLLTQFQNFYPSLPVFTEKVSDTFSARSYNICVENHKLDSDFYKNDWRIYLKSKDEVWGETGDLVRIMDGAGYTLASLIY